ncbi:carboxypeptidase N subunit 2 isoform X1 [Teleopsis dalmanni]|uniref:carboxypeptidase N subunit 2 isoform X1 n=1 Tax=Teleopsis dalmanni TaxID=139649 RepID=UPI0018CD0A1D|nr:carboxypeptidase N subunit 2 isoform X1 [Teleopsis dalmanni]
MGKCFYLLSVIILSQLGSGLQQSITIEQFEKFQSQYLSNIPSNDVTNCSLNACEALKMLSHLLLTMKSSIPLSTTEGSGKRLNRKQQVVANDSEEDTAQIASMYLDLNKQVRQIESRLRSVEQPVWRLTPGITNEWNHCTSGVCRCHPETKSFICWNTNLKSVPVTQVIPMNMVRIDISRNYLSTLHKDTFRGLTLLQQLDLSNNVLDFLPFDLFRDLDSLVQLRIQSNQLEDLDPRTFWKLRNLNLLDLSKNMITELPESIFNHVQRLTVINLSSNKIKIFPPGLLRDQLVLEELDLSRNEIITLQSGSMKYLTQLKVLDFSWNAIAFVSDDFFEDLKNLRTLILHNNRITSISRSIFENLEQLGTLDLTMNRISKIDGNAFSELGNLRELFLGQNSLSRMPHGLFLNANSMTRLALFSNNLTTLEADDFQGLTNLKYLMLNNNILKYFDGQAFAPLQNLEKLRIDSNKLQYLPHGALYGLDKLIAVKLDKNPWHCDCRALYLARYIREHQHRLWDGQPVCRGPGDLGGGEVGLLRYDDLCDGQWASMLSLSPRLPVRKHRISTPMNYTDYFNLYLKHIYFTTTNENLLDAQTTLRTSRRFETAASITI